MKGVNGSKKGSMTRSQSLIISKTDRRNRKTGRSTYLECRDWIRSRERYLGNRLGLIIDCITKKPVMHWRTHLSSIPASKRPDSKEVYETSSRLR
jgi:hypothetical protein